MNNKLNENQQIIIPKRILNWEFYRNYTTRNLFFHCLFRSDNNGEFYTTVSELSQETQLSIKQTRNAIVKLQKAKIVKILKGQNKGKKQTFIKVCKYDSYISIKNKKGKIKAIKKNIFSFEVETLYLQVIKYFPEVVTKDMTEIKVNKWKNELRKLIEIDKCSPIEIEAIVKNTRNSFWKPNFLTILKLRRVNKEGIKYYTVFKELMNSKNNTLNKNPYKISEDIKDNPNRLSI